MTIKIVSKYKICYLLVAATMLLQFLNDV